MFSGKKKTPSQVKHEAKRREEFLRKKNESSAKDDKDKISISKTPEIGAFNRKSEESYQKLEDSAKEEDKIEEEDDNLDLECDIPQLDGSVDISTNSDKGENQKEDTIVDRVLIECLSEVGNLQKDFVEMI